MRKRTTKSLLAIVMTAVLVFGMAVPGFAVYGYENGGSDNGTYVDVAAEQTAMPTDLLTHETQITSPAALAIGIQPFNNPPTTYVIIDLTTLTLGTAASGTGWDLSAGGTLQITSNGAFRFVGGSAPAVFVITFSALVSNADIIMDAVNITAWNMPGGNNNVSLWLEGSNSITMTGAPGIAIAATSSLEINGPGSLNVTGTPLSGIYGGSLTLNSGTLTVSGNTNGITSNLTVNDGSLTVTGGTNGITSPNLDINGGSVNANTITTPQGNITITGNPSITTTGGNPVVWISQQPQGASFTVGSISGNLSVSAHTSQGTLSYQWEHVGTGNLGTTSTIAIPTGLAVGNHSFRVTVTSGGTNLVSDTVTITISDTKFVPPEVTVTRKL